MLYYQSLPVHSNNKIMLLQDIDVGLERTKMDIEARSQSKKDQMSGKVSFQNKHILPLLNQTPSLSLFWGKLFASGIYVHRSLCKKDPKVQFPGGMM